VEGLLVVFPLPAPGAEPIAPGRVLAGLPLLRRIVLAAERAGLVPLVVGFAPAEVEATLAGTSAIPLAPDRPRPAPPSRRLVFLSAALIPQPEWLRAIREMPLEAGRLYVDGLSAAVLEASDPAWVLETARRCSSVAEAVAALRPTFAAVECAFDRRGRFTLAAARDLDDAETWLLRSLIKPSEGFMSRHFERRISLALTRRLCVTGITPNTITLVSVAVGLVGAFFFLSPDPGHQLAGALLFLEAPAQELADLADEGQPVADRALARLYGWYWVSFCC